MTQRQPHQKKLSLSLLKGLKGKPKEDFEELFRNNTIIREQLTKVVADKRKEHTKATDYDNPSWSHRQADLNGYNRALNEILELIDLNEDYKR